MAKDVYRVELGHKEAVVLRQICRSVGGLPGSTPRGTMDAIEWGLKGYGLPEASGVTIRGSVTVVDTWPVELRSR